METGEGEATLELLLYQDQMKFLTALSAVLQNGSR
jgi:hypothetical protein